MSNWRVLFKVFGCRVVAIEWYCHEVLYRFMRSTPFGFRAKVSGDNYIRLADNGTWEGARKWVEL
jgi:hypothetical protein